MARLITNERISTSQGRIPIASKATDLTAPTIPTTINNATIRTTTNRVVLTTTIKATTNRAITKTTTNKGIRNNAAHTFLNRISNVLSTT